MTAPGASQVTPASRSGPLIRQMIGQELRKARLQQGLTLGQMRYKSGVTRGYITEIEQGDREASSRTLAKLFDALGVVPEISLHVRKGE